MSINHWNILHIPRMITLEMKHCYFELVICAYRNAYVRRFVNSMFEIHPLKRGLLQNVMTIIISGD